MPINLLPQALAEAQRAREVRRLATIGSLASFLLVLVVCLALFSYKLYLRSQVISLEKSVQSGTVELTAFADLEAKILDIDRRSAAVKNHLDSSFKYSALLDKVVTAVPVDITVSDITISSSKTLSISGLVRTYPALSSFLTSLVSDGVESFFSSAELRSLEVDPSGGARKFVADLEINGDLLRE